jgi:CBS domain-containing protein
MNRYVESFLKPVVTTGPDDSLSAVGQLMQQHNVGAVVVVEQSRPVGIVTDRDLALALAVGHATLHTPVAKVMRTPVETISTGDGVFQATQQMREGKIRRLVVVDDDGCLAGIVTFDDLLRLLSRELSNLLEGIQPEIASR